MRAALVRVRRVINGRRGAFQALFGFAFLALGSSYILRPPSPGREQTLSYLEFIPMDVMGIPWLLAGALGLWGATQPRPRDKWSFIALTLTPTAWGFLYIASSVLGVYEHAWVSCVAYWAMAGGLMVGAGMSGDNDRDEREVREVIR